MIKRKAFTLFEVVMVIIVLGIVSSMGLDILLNLYKNYIRANAVNRLQGQAEIVLEQITQRLQYRIKDSARAFATNADGTLNGNIVSISDATNAQQGIEWIGYSNESFLKDDDESGWSGFIDLENIETNASVTAALRTLSTPGSDLFFADDIIKALTFNDVALDGTSPNLPALIFKGAKTPFYVNGYYDGNYTVRVFHNDSNSLGFTETADNNITDFDNDGFSDIFEQYYLSHTAYAIAPVQDGGANDFNLTLYYNYQPWHGETYDNNGTKAVLAEHVSTFQFIQQGSSLRLKICIHDDNRSSMGFDFSACKEQVVF